MVDGLTANGLGGDLLPIEPEPQMKRPRTVLPFRDCSRTTSAVQTILFLWASLPAIFCLAVHK